MFFYWFFCRLLLWLATLAGGSYTCTLNKIFFIAKFLSQIFWVAVLYRGFNANVGSPEGGLEVALSDGVREEEGEEGAGQRQQDPGWPTYIVQVVEHRNLQLGSAQIELNEYFSLIAVR